METKVDQSVVVLELEQTLGQAWISNAHTRLEAPGRSIVIRGGVDGFCRGLPLDQTLSGQLDAPAGIRALAMLLARLQSDPRPIAALVQGDAFGGGVGMAAVADVVIAYPTARFQLPEVLLGIIPAAVMPVIARRVGWTVTRRMALGEAAMTANEALQCGLVDVVSENPDRELTARLERWRRADPAALAAVRRLAGPAFVQEDAFSAFAGLWNAGAQPRIRRFVEGETPWEDEE
jgi:enoyl-CoA hydratase/carnithine racemase